MATLTRNAQANRSNYWSMLWFVFIWLSWKAWIWLIGVESEPINNRKIPALSSIWEAFNDQFRLLLLHATELAVQGLGFSTIQHGESIWIAGYRGVSVGNYCLGVQLMFYHAALMFISPISWNKRLLYAFVGALCIQLLNVLRISGLLLISVYKPSLLILSHDYLFMIPIVALTLWFYYRTSIKHHGN